MNGCTNIFASLPRFASVSLPSIMPFGGMLNGASPTSALFGGFQAPIDSYTPPSGNTELLNNFYEMPVIDHHFFNPIPSLTSEERYLDYAGIPKHLLTAHTSLLIRCWELRQYFLGLTLDQIREQPKEIRQKAKELTNLVHEVMSLYTRDGFLAAFARSKMRENAFAKRGSIVMVLDLKVRPLNEADKSKELGDWYMPALRSFIQRYITKRMPSDKGEPFAIVQAPQNTALILVTSDTKRGKLLLDRAFEAFQRYEPVMRAKLKESIKKGKLSVKIDPGNIKFEATGFMKRALLKISDELDSEIDNVLKSVTSTAAFFKAHSDTDRSCFSGGGITVYDQRAVPEPGDTLYPAWKHFLSKEIGYVPMGEFIPKLIRSAVHIYIIGNSVRGVSALAIERIRSLLEKQSIKLADIAEIVVTPVDTAGDAWLVGDAYTVVR